MDLSLDEFIKKKKIDVRKGRGGAVTKKGARGGVRGQRQASAGGRNTQGQRGRTGRGPARTAPRGARASNRGVGLTRPSARPAVATGPTKITISNLDFQVNDRDIRELFSEFGVLKSAAVHYDKNGKSLGTSDVVFERRNDAIKAMKQYNGVPLDGRPMKIEMSLSEIPAMSAALKLASPRRGVPAGRRAAGGATRNAGGNAGGARRGRGATRGTRGGRGARGGRGGKPKVTAEDLDKELDSYNAKMET